MVKVVTPAAMGVPDIVKFADLTRTGPAPGTPGAPINALATAKEAVNSIDDWIKIADKGVTLLGRVDSILGRVQAIQGNQRPQQQQGPGPVQQPPPRMIQAAPPDMVVNADPAFQQQQAAPAPVQVQQPPQADPQLPAAGPGRVPVHVIVQALDTVEKLQPGITAAQLSDSIKRNPEQVQRLLDVFAGQMK